MGTAMSNQYLDTLALRTWVFLVALAMICVSSSGIDTTISDGCVNSSVAFKPIMIENAHIQFACHSL